MTEKGRRRSILHCAGIGSSGGERSFTWPCRNGEVAPKAALAGPQWNREARPSKDILGYTSGSLSWPESGVRLVDMPTAGSRQLIEQPLCFFQIGGVETLGERTVDGGEQIMSLGPPALLAPQPTVAARSS